MQTIVLTASPSQMAIAKSIGTALKQAHDNGRLPSDCRGDGVNLAGDIQGALAEVTLVQWLETNGYPVRDWQPYDFRPDGQADFRMGGIPFDVKAVRPGSKYCTINEASRQRMATIPGLHYWPVCLLDNEQMALCLPIPAATVAGWRLMTPKDNPNIRSAFRSCRVDCLEPLVHAFDLCFLLDVATA